MENITNCLEKLDDIVGCMQLQMEGFQKEVADPKGGTKWQSVCKADKAVVVSNISSCYFKDIACALNQVQTATNNHNLITGQIRTKFSSLQKSESTIGPLCGLYDDTNDPDSVASNAGRDLRVAYWCDDTSSDTPKVKKTTALLDFCLKNQSFPIPPNVEILITLTANDNKHLVHVWDPIEQAKNVVFRVKLLRLELEFFRIETSQAYIDKAFAMMKRQPQGKQYFSYQSC